MIRTSCVGTVLAMLVLSACGSAEDDDQARVEAAATTTTSTPPTTTPPTTTTTVATTTTTVADSGSLEAWCLALASPAPDVEEPISSEDLEALYTAIQARTEAMLEVAPAEIAEANQTVVDFGRELNAHLADNDWDPNAPRLAGDNAAFAAQMELEQFSEDNC